MKSYLLAAAAITAAFTVMASAQVPIRPVPVPRPDDQGAYQPQPQQKPLPPEGYIPGVAPMPGQQQPAQGGLQPYPVPQQGGLQPYPVQGQGQSLAAPSIGNEDAFVQAYVAKRSPRIMVFVNRTIQGDPLPKDGLEEVMRTEERQAASGAVNVNSNKTDTSNSQSTSAGYTASATNTNSSSVNSNSFASGGPAEYTRTTSVRKAADKYDVFGATSEDYELIEASLVRYFDNSGKVQIKDSESARAKLTREQILRIENGDPSANRLLNTELQQDILIRVTAKPTQHASQGAAVRLIAKAVATTDARNLGTAFVDMQLPISKTNVNIFTRYLSEQLMGQMAQKWTQSPEYDPIEVRIYKTASVDDGLKIQKWLRGTPDVKQVRTNSATGGSTTSYSSFAVGFQGAPEDLYGLLKEEIGMSQGLKAVDLSNNTITLEVTGQMNLVTTTRRSETKTITETKVIEDRKVEPINPAPVAPIPPQ